LAELIGIPAGNDRYVQMAELLRQGEAAGLITSAEHFSLRSVIGPQM